MSGRIRYIAVLAAQIALVPALAGAFTAQNQMQVQQAGTTDIVVQFVSQADDTDYWCAAGDYAVRAMGASSGSRLYRATPKPRGQGQGITFTLDPNRAAAGAGVASFGAGGGDGSMAVGQAVGSYCRPFPYRERN